MVQVRLIPKKGATLHDFPYATPQRKCLHCWIINVTPPGPNQCLHQCLYCYGREAIYSNLSPFMLIYNNLPELVAKDLKRIRLCPPISISNITDPCQNVLELRGEVKRLVELIMNYGVAFFITTKGDPSFLLELPGFIQYKPKFIALTIEGTADILESVSPLAPSFASRVDFVHRLSRLGIKTIIRFDPVFIHLFRSLYGESWFKEIEKLVKIFARTGARHIVASTGRLWHRPLPGCRAEGMWQRLYNLIKKHSAVAAKEFERDYIFDRSATSQGYLLRKDLRLKFHLQVKELVEAEGLTYATCQELSPEESDSPGIPNCEGLLVPFSLKQLNGKFEPIEGCTANCHHTCRVKEKPPCGQAKLIDYRPFKISYLR